MFKTRYKYTCPDVVHYRRNQYRFAIYSNVVSIAYMAAFWGGLSYISKKNAPIVTTDTNPES